ncbi:MAG: CDP-glycerol glycerophosphotransferase family protein, partial [Clostridia bacterium]|nr:CDP-glycerol glycerophosphotransferase family protein [Clostridia bacterium]
MRKAIERFPGLEKICRRSVMRLDHTLKGVDPLKVVFSCFLGRFYGDSPRCISERLHQRCPEARIVWLFNREAMARVRDELPDYVKPVSFKSREALTELATARVWVDNFTKHNYISLDPRRQAYIQTWHGDRAIKKICYDLEVSGDRRIEEQCARVVTGSRFGEDMFRTAFRYKGEYIRSGSPRNDILLRGDPKERDRVRRALGIGPDTGVLLYAPTYRDNASVLPRSAQMDLERTLGCLEEVTGRRWICLFRAHYKSRGIDLQAVADRLVDVTKYEEMAELLLAADVCLTDYSSCAMDFILQDRPALFYIPDWEEYVSTRGVYFDVHDAPFFIASDQCELETLIQSLTPGKVRENCAAIREWFGYYESG